MFGSRSEKSFLIVVPEYLEDSMPYLKKNSLYIFDGIIMSFAQKQQKFIILVNETSRIKCISYSGKYLDKEKIIDETNTQFIRVCDLSQKIKGVFITINEIQKIPETTLTLRGYISSFEVLQSDNSSEAVPKKGHYGCLKQAKVVILDYKSPVDEMVLYLKFDETIIDEIKQKFKKGRLVQLKSVKRKVSMDLRFNFVLEYDEHKINIYENETYDISMNFKQKLKDSEYLMKTNPVILNNLNPKIINRNMIKVTCEIETVLFVNLKLKCQ